MHMPSFEDPPDDSLPRVECYFARFSLQQLCLLIEVARVAIFPEAMDLAIWLVKAVDAELERREQTEKGNYIEPTYPAIYPAEWNSYSTACALATVSAWVIHRKRSQFRPLAFALLRVFSFLAIVNLRKEECHK